MKEGNYQPIIQYRASSIILPVARHWFKGIKIRDPIFFSNICNTPGFSGESIIPERQKDFCGGRPQVLPGLAQGDKRQGKATLGGNQVMQLIFDEKTGLLTPNKPPAVYTKVGAGPRHLDFSPNNRFAYMLSELDGNVNVYAVDYQTGLLSAIQSISLSKL
jgi:hypothetical protein